MPFEVERITTHRDGGYAGKKLPELVPVGDDITERGEIPLDYLPEGINLKIFTIEEAKSGIYKGKLVLPSAKFVASGEGLLGVAQLYTDPDYGECDRIEYVPVDKIPEVNLGTFILRRQLQDPAWALGDVYVYRLRYTQPAQAPTQPTQTRLIPVASSGDYAI